MDSQGGVYLLGGPRPTSEERCLERLVQFVGLEAVELRAPAGRDRDTSPIHIVGTCRSLAGFCEQPGARAWLTRQLAVTGSSVFLTGIDDSPEHLAVLETLVPGAVEAVVPFNAGAAPYRVSPRRETEMPHFAGLAFGAAVPRLDRTFVLGAAAADHSSALVTIGERPCFVKIQRGAAAFYLLACDGVLDLDAPAGTGRQPIDQFLEFVPVIAYLRATFGARCWHNERPAACLIIDDPLLRPRYGFLDFDRIESLMTRAAFSLNIAFIPWNCRRTDRRIADKFIRSSRRLSISVHGCDHTEAEFGMTDGRRVRRQARRAQLRMNLHRELTGIEHNRVMVFPQGVFSRVSLEALGDEGFLAAVNSTVQPVDAPRDMVTVRDLLSVAVLRFGGVPLFMRQYPDRLEKFALDLFLGKQVLIVEHHGLFRHGYEAAEGCVTFVNSIAPNIRWTDLESLCASATLERALPNGDVDLRAFGPVATVENRRAHRTRVRVSNEWARAQLDSVRWNGATIAHTTRPAGTRCDLDLEPDELGTLFFRAVQNAETFEPGEPSVKERVKVFVRRRLSEVRDNYLDRSPVLSQLARAGKAILPRL